LHGIIAWRGAFRKQESGTGARETAGDGERYGRERPGKKRETSDTGSRDFPVTSDAVQPKFGGGVHDGALAVFSPDGSKLLYATYLGGSGDEMIRSIALGPNGEVHLVGSTSSPDFPVTPNALQKTHAGKGDAFIVKLVPR